MNRSEMIEKAAEAIAKKAGGSAYYWLPEAADVVDVLLPQVTTAEELEALPNSNTWLASNGVHPSKALRRAPFWRGHDFAAFGPLTVVWQP